MDIYGNMLTAKQRDILADYYERDFSLSEIADNAGISRQAVHFAVKQAEESLADYESKLGVYTFIKELNGKIRMLGGENSESVADLEDFIRSKYGTVR